MSYDISQIQQLQSDISTLATNLSNLRTTKIDAVNAVEVDLGDIGIANGVLTLGAASPTDPNQAVTKAYVDANSGNTSQFAAVAVTGDYGDLLNKPTIPSNNNQLTNGAGYATVVYVDAQIANVDFSDYSNTAQMEISIDSSNTAMKSYVDAQIANVDFSDYSTTIQMNTAIAASNTLIKTYVDGEISTVIANTQNYTDTAIADLVDSAPVTLDTLNELAAALGDDANFSATTATALGYRLRVDTSAQNLTSTQKTNALTNLGITASISELNTAAFINDKGLYTNDLDNLTSESDEGYYSWSSTEPTNSPGWTHSGLFVLKDINQNIQLAFGASGNGAQRLAIRRADSGSYTGNAWTEFWSTRNFSSTDISNWNTAYGWGDHSTAGYWSAGNDGASSGLDADTLDGQQLQALQESYARIEGWNPAYSNSDEASVYYDFSERAVAIYSSSDNQIGASYKAVPVTAGERVKFNVQIKGNTASSSGLYVRIYYYTGDLPAGKTHVSNSASHTLVQEDTAGDSGWYENGAITTSYVSFTREWIAPTTGYVSLVILNWSGHSTNKLFVKDANIKKIQTLQQTDRNIVLRSGSTSAAALLLEDKNDAFRVQLYGAGGDYGFLASEWGAWDIRKTPSGNMTLNNSTSNIVWHAGNDGSGSGLDADLLDGQQGSYYAPASHVHSYLPLTGGTLTGTLTTSGSLNIGSAIGSRSSSLSVESNGSSSPIAAKSSLYNTVWGILPWSGGQTYISSGIYYDDGAWVHASDNTNNCLFSISGSGASWYASNNSTGSWNLASNVSLWNSSGNWNRALSTNATYNGSTIWHAGNDGSGSALDADLLDGLHASDFMKLATSSTSTTTQVFSIASGQPMLWRDTDATNGTNCNIYSYWYAQGTTLGYIGYGSGSNSHLYLSNASVGSIYLASTSVNGFLANGYVMWHAGNDGSGSGLDADTVDGIEASGLLQVAATQDITGHKEFQNDVELRFGTSANVRMEYRATGDFYCRSYTHGGRLLFQGENSSGSNKALVYMDPDDATSLYHAGVLVAYTYSSGWRVTGNVLATGDVYAYYSDERLKDKTGKIEKALDKVDAIETFYYTHNDKANELGYEGKKQQVGVSAQSVESVMPEIVHLAAIDDDGKGNSISGENYKTVQYEKLVPLLIESIKELRAEIKELKENIK
jgi:hypothetical protein